MPNNPDVGFKSRADGKQAQEQDVGGEEDGGERGKDRGVTKTSIAAKKLIVYSQSPPNARHPLMQERNLIFRVIIGLNILYGKSLYNRGISHQS